MRDLSTVRQGWVEMEREEVRLACVMSPQESFHIWLRLQQAFESQLLDTATLFGPERQAALAGFQARLGRLATWQERHGGPGSVYPKSPAAPPGS